MARDLGPGTVRRIAALFPAERRAEVADLLVSRCGEDPFSSDRMAEIERIRFAVLRISGGSIDRLRAAIALARIDWRDALVGAGFGDDTRAHLRWLAEDESIGEA